MSAGSKSGFTMVEVMVAVALIGVAVAGLVGGLGAVTSSYRRAVEREAMDRLAQQKLDELVATGEWTTASEGEFVGERYANATWEIETEPTSIDGLEHLRLTVTYSRQGRRDSRVAEGLAYRPTTTTVPLEGA